MTCMAVEAHGGSEWLKVLQGTGGRGLDIIIERG